LKLCRFAAGLLTPLLFAAAAQAQFVCSSAASGNWNSAGTWSACNSGYPSSPSDSVVINSGNTVAFNVTQANLHGLVVDGALNLQTGTLNLATSGTTGSNAGAISDGTLYANSGVTFTNASTGTLSSVSLTGLGTWNNYGTLDSVQNGATVNFLGSAGVLEGTSTGNMGVWAVASGNVLNLSGATLSGGALSGAGSILATGTNTLTGVKAQNFTGAGGIEIQSGTTTLGSNFSGTFAADSGATLGAGGANLSSSYTTGSNTVSVSGSGSGTWHLADGSSLNLTGNSTLSGTLASISLSGSVAVNNAAATLNNVNNNGAITASKSLTVSGTSTNTGSWTTSGSGSALLSSANLTGGTIAGSNWTTSGANILNGVANNSALSFGWSVTLSGTSTSSG
jgi:hypothetical protein